MKKLAITAVLLLSACAGSDKSSSVNPAALKIANADTVVAVEPVVMDSSVSKSDSIFETRPVKNTDCEPVSQIKIIQVLSGGGLGLVCEDRSPLCLGQTVFVVDEPGIEYFDGLKLKSDLKNCFVFRGVHQYKTKEGFDKTIPMVYIEPITKQVPVK